MAGKKTKEGTAQMIAQYCELKDQGYSVAQIAKKFGLCIQTVYNNLERISKESGRPLEELRRAKKTRNEAPETKPKTKSESPVREEKNEAPQQLDDTDTDKLRKDFKELEVKLDGICAEIRIIVDAEKSMPTLTLMGGEKDE